MPGPLPEENATRRNKHDELEMSGKGASEVPKLRGRSGFRTATLEWWETWATSPQAEHFMESDWQRLMMLAHLVEQFYETPDKALMAEIRINEEKLGATVADRQRLRMKFPKAEIQEDDEETPEDLEDEELYGRLKVVS